MIFVGEGLGNNASGALAASPEAQLLGKMIDAMGLKRDQVFVANSAAALANAQGEIVVRLGETPLEAASPVVDTFHPALVLQRPELKKPVWEALQKVMARLGLKR